MTPYVAILFFIVVGSMIFRARRTVRRGIDAINTSKTITPEIFQQLQNGTAVPMSSIFPVMTKLLNPDILPSIKPNMGLSGAWQDWQYVWADMMPSARAVSANSLMTVIIATMPGEVQGTIYWTRQPALGGSWTLSDPLESIEFNNGVKVMASNRQLAQSVLSPDFMAWVLDHGQPDMLFFRQQFCLLWFAADRQPDEVVSDATKVFNFVHHSGALVKNT